MEKNERKWQFYSVLFKMEFFYFYFGQTAASERTFHWCHVYTCMLIKTFDIYIFQNRWQTPRISRSYSGIILSFACSCMHIRQVILFTFSIHMFPFIRPLGDWSLLCLMELDESGILLNSNFSFWHSLLHCIHIRMIVFIAGAIIKFNTYILQSLCFEAMRCVSLTLPHIKSRHI